MAHPSFQLKKAQNDKYFFTLTATHLWNQTHQKLALMTSQKRL